jgi:hypothetical protein
LTAGNPALERECRQQKKQGKFFSNFCGMIYNFYFCEKVARNG